MIRIEAFSEQVANFEVSHRSFEETKSSTDRDEPIRYRTVPYRTVPRGTVEFQGIWISEGFPDQILIPDFVFVSMVS